jgi:hypothetical protein
MGLSGVVAFLFVIEPSAHLTDPGRARRYAVSVGLVPQHSRRLIRSPRRAGEKWLGDGEAKSFGSLEG